MLWHLAYCVSISKAAFSYSCEQRMVVTGMWIDLLELLLGNAPEDDTLLSFLVKICQLTVC